ncbi:MAG: ATPase, partial [Nitrospirae bacterium]
MERLRRLLAAVEGRPYGAYKRLAGRYRLPGLELAVDHVQGDPFAAPSRVTLEVPMETARLPEGWWRDPVRRLALEDYLARRVAEAIATHVRGHRGSGKSGEVAILPCGQEVLRRTSVVVGPSKVEARITVGLPAAGRRCLGREAEAILLGELPRVARHALTADHLDAAAVAAHLDTVEDHHHLQGWLEAAGLAAFVADGSLLPRASGVDDRPLAAGGLPFEAPEGLARVVELPHAGPVRGLAIPQGVTLIVGGGFHGKSTLLRALERGVHPHVPGDGRERIATLASAVKVRAEDGRAVGAVDIRPFIDNLPLGRDCRRFTTDNASGSTSQAAAIVEALGVGCRLLLLDEDTSATNFMIRDARMQQLVARSQEPITPFLHRVRELHERLGVSTILVMGGSGDYFEVADTVIQME